MGGYFKTSALASTAVNGVASALLLLCAFPFFIILPILIKAIDGGPVFYRGTRLGRDKKPFTMYKFRTLAPDAHTRIGNRLLNPSDHLETPIGGFLRETRLDELPQLINVLKGDMDLVGPRPERPEIYEKLCAHIPGYDLRFRIKPGVIGYSQIFTPHSAPKRARTLIDNYFIRRKQNLLFDTLFFMYALLRLVLRGVIKTSAGLLSLFRRRVLNRRGSEQRQWDRVVHDSAWTIVLSDAEGQEIARGRLVDINDEALVTHLDRQLPADTEYLLKLEIKIQSGFGNKQIKKKIVRCQGKVFRATPGEDVTVRHVILFKPATPLNELKLHKYFLYKSIT